jgi:hypothetical protein
MDYFEFTVDSALLKELGENLVGKPHIALAELIKNGYDADAQKITIEFDPDQDRIVVSDFGHGMDVSEFKAFWMRIGSTHKKGRTSRHLGRLMTGSKGIGRLAVQFLASKLTVYTTSEYNLNTQLKAQVQWSEAVTSGELVNAKVYYETFTSSEGYASGTRLVLEGMKQSWSPEDVRGLAREIWWLRSPFRSQFAEKNPMDTFDISFLSNNTVFKDTFDRQMEAVLTLWKAKIVGKNEDGKVTLSLQFADEPPKSYSYEIKDCPLKRGDWEVRIFDWVGKQRFGIKVNDAREYFGKFGGVHVYDSGFHLPFYGDPRNDWLRIEIDHSHRLSFSKLLPSDLQVENGLQFLPTISRIFGVVNVASATEPNLIISVTRDRFQESKSLDALDDMIRFGLDWYANEEKNKHIEGDRAKVITESTASLKIEDVLSKHEPEMPKEVFKSLKDDFKKIAAVSETQAQETAKKVSLIGPLATAGISTLAYQHELRQQFGSIEDILKQIDDIKTDDPKLRDALLKLKTDLSAWVVKAKATNGLFAYYTYADNIKVLQRFPAKKVLQEIRSQVKVLSRGIPIELNSVDEKLLLPKGTLVEWSSIFQNVFVNAFNALVDSQSKLIKVMSLKDGVNYTLLVQDTGSGVDLKNSEILFEPFERRAEISQERKALGYGGMGLGLTIVRMIAENLGCSVKFVKPEKGFKTAFSLSWREKD